jgi:hypothetical protein
VSSAVRPVRELPIDSVEENVLKEFFNRELLPWMREVRACITSPMAVSVRRITADTTLDATYHTVFADTDGGDITITLPAIVQNREYRIVNTGSSVNQAFVAPDGTDLLVGASSSFTLNDGESLIIGGDETEGWY